jgi:hypothetical protein
VLHRPRAGGTTVRRGASGRAYELNYRVPALWRRPQPGT